MHKSPELIIQITAGFNYKSSDSVEVKVDSSNYDFYTDSDTAWAKDDEKVIYAMKKGLEFVTKGLSSKGTEVIDTYSLKGFTAAINKISLGPIFAFSIPQIELTSILGSPKIVPSPICSNIFLAVNIIFKFYLLLESK